jgi:hypothetical protein
MPKTATKRSFHSIIGSQVEPGRKLRCLNGLFVARMALFAEDT